MKDITKDDSLDIFCCTVFTALMMLISSTIALHCLLNNIRGWRLKSASPVV